MFDGAMLQNGQPPFYASSPSPYSSLPPGPSREAENFEVAQKLVAIETLAVQLPLPSLDALSRWLPMLLEVKRRLEVDRPFSINAMTRSSPENAPMAPRPYTSADVDYLSQMPPRPHTSATAGHVQEASNGVSTAAIVGQPQEALNGPVQIGLTGLPAQQIGPGGGVVTEPMSNSVGPSAPSLYSPTQPGNVPIDNADRAGGSADGSAVAALFQSSATPSTTATLGMSQDTSSTAVTQAPPVGPTVPVASTTRGDLFNQLDVNKDGLLTREEFAALPTAQSQIANTPAVVPTAQSHIANTSDVVVGPASDMGVQQVQPSQIQQPVQNDTAVRTSMPIDERGEVLGIVFALQERIRQLERRLAEERAIAMASSVEGDARDPSAFHLEDQFRAGIDNHLRNFQLGEATPIAELIGQKMELQQRAQRLEQELAEQRALTATPSVPASPFGNALIKSPAP